MSYRLPARLLVLMLLGIVLFGAALPAWGKPRELHIALDDGKLRSDDLTRHLGLGAADWLSGDIDLRGVRGALFVRAMNKALGEGCNINLAADDSELIVRFDVAKLPVNVNDAKRAVRTFTATAAPRATSDQQRLYGLNLPPVREFIEDGSLPLVILVHGLDCNWSNWTPMANQLIREGYQVAYFAYPSDQPLDESAAMLSEQMALFREIFPAVPIHIVAHSMGALVARAFVEGDDYPAIGGVKSLIMLAPPNHGSKWARLRGALEIEEHYKLWRDERRWRPSWTITDGLGEAGRDLESDSSFIERLNERPRRDGVYYATIMGNKHPAAIITARYADAAADVVPESARSRWGLRQYVRALHNVADELRNRNCSSDGPVSIASARLDGVDYFTIVDADHTSIYIPTEAQPHPQAWDIVVDRLNR